MKSDKIPELLDEFKNGSTRALAKFLTLVENQQEKRAEIINRLYPLLNYPVIIAITGAPGAGKSSLINQLLFTFSVKYAKIAVLAFDPSSQISGGAFLGDRLRLNEHLANDNIYIRSFASRGAHGGLSSAIYDLLTVTSSFGFDLILLETVGIGQTDYKSSEIADLVVLVLDPLFGDDMQILKAGALEYSDIVALTKKDVLDTSMLEAEIKQLAGSPNSTPIVVSCSTKTGEGLELLYSRIIEKLEHLYKNGTILQKRKNRYSGHLRMILETKVADLLMAHSSKLPIDAVDLSQSPYESSRSIFEQLLKQENGIV